MQQDRDEGKQETESEPAAAAHRGRASAAAGRGRLDGNGHRGEALREDLAGAASAQVGLRAEDQTVRQDGRREGTNVIGDDVVSPLQDGVRLSGSIEAEGGARAGAELYRRMLPRRPYQGDGVCLDVVADMDRAGQA